MRPGRRRTPTHAAAGARRINPAERMSSSVTAATVIQARAACPPATPVAGHSQSTSGPSQIRLRYGLVKVDRYLMGQHDTFFQFVRRTVSTV